MDWFPTGALLEVNKIDFQFPSKDGPDHRAKCGFVFQNEYHLIGGRKNGDKDYTREHLKINQKGVNVEKPLPFSMWEGKCLTVDSNPNDKFALACAWR